MFRPLLWITLMLMAVTAPAADAPALLPDSQPLTWDGELADRMMDGLHRFIERKIDKAVQSREQFWKRDTSSREAYGRSVTANRERLKTLIGLVDARVPVALEVLSNVGEDGMVGTVQSRRAQVDEGSVITVFRVRWSVLDGVYAEGLLLKPHQDAVGAIVVIPDADQTPEQVVGIADGDADVVETEHQFARHLAENGFLVLIPTLVSRSDEHSGNELVTFTNQTHREWLWRQAYHMGRHIVGLEVHKVLAGVDWLKTQIKPSQKVAVAGSGEGGLLAMVSAAVDPRIDACLASGYFEQHLKPWDEPLYRHTWAMHREFGDAELATLIAPRSLVIDDAAFPTDAGPPVVRPGRRPAAAIGKLVTPSQEVVAREFERISKLIPQGIQRRILVPRKNDQASAGVSEASLDQLTRSLGERYQFEPKTYKLITGGVREGFDVAARQKRQVVELERFLQRLVRESDHARDKYFPVTALAQQAKASVKDQPTNAARSPLIDQTFAALTAKYREHFYNEVLGRFDDALLPFNAKTRKIYDTEKWTGYDVVLDVFPDVFAWGVLLLPKDLKPGEKRPVVVCQHGRNGLPKVVIENNEKAYHDYAAKLAERGFIVFAPHNPYRGEDKYRFLSRKANCVKASLFSFILAQHEQILNWLSSLPQVDANRIAFYGLSYGGETAVRVPPLLDRYCLSICSADFNDWARKVCATDAKYSFMFTIEWEMPYFGMGSTFNYSEMVALLAPRPFMVERGHWDGVAPDEWVAYEYAKVRRMYDTLGIGDRTEIEFFDGLHEINGQGTFNFLHKHLKWPPR